MRPAPQQGQRAAAAMARPSIQGLSIDSGKCTQGGLRPQAILSTMSVFVLAAAGAQNQADIARQSLSFNEFEVYVCAVKPEFVVKNRPGL